MRLSKSMIALFLGPAVLIYLVIFLYPTARTLAMSFFTIPNLSSKMGEWKFVGFDNYADMFNSSYFIGSVKNVLGIWLIGGVLIFFFAFLYAVILTSGVKGKTFWRSLIFLPNTVSAVVMSVVWLQYIYNPSFGLLTSVFNRLGLTSLAEIQWTDNEHIYYAMIIAFSFGSIGYFMLILNAGINRIPADYYEVATIEGANPWIKFYRITLPLLRDVFRTTLVLWTITAFNFFVWSATFGLDDPHTVTPGYYMYQKVFGMSKASSMLGDESFNVGAGASVGILITLATLLASALINKLFPKDRLEY
ncbi:carbohydrate ABC transporter permease [Paenibacillus albus]|uniref:Sugar ABC transporter permease n=1 Tax=Paenibacillus albus TaxID=2495582 RepID=A0A3Q8X6X9_9BACL|nr:sugar ABC transporter permease [Paenibacillus albus]AZN41878.1 sugar ABC transporter permease [Paenibacillus albus]